MHRPYTDLNNNSLDMTKDLTQIKIYERNYWRPPSNFNPTLTENGLPYPYPYLWLYEKGLISQAGYNDDKVKFMIFNSNLTVINFNITDFN
jgi:hypothetical protein